MVHCADTPPSMDIGAKEIRDWHLAKGWQDIGYHFVIRRDGTLETGRPQDSVGSHVKGYNGVSVGICLVGGRASHGTEAETNFTLEQMSTLVDCIHRLRKAYPDAAVVGHNQLNPGKACPSFDVPSFLSAHTI